MPTTADALRRHQLRRQRTIRARQSRRWLVVAVIGLAGGWLLGGGTPPDRWGPTREVVVAVQPIKAGDALSAANVRLEARPSRLTPDGALGALPAGRPATANISRGEVVTAARVGGSAALGPGLRAIAVPVSGPVVTLVPGDVVDLYSTSDQDGAVVSAATVVTTTRDAITVTVREADAGRLAAAMGHGAVVPARRGR